MRRQARFLLISPDGNNLFVSRGGVEVVYERLLQLHVPPYTISFAIEEFCKTAQVGEDVKLNTDPVTILVRVKNEI